MRIMMMLLGLLLVGCETEQEAYDHCNDGMSVCLDEYGVHIPGVNVCLRWYNACIEDAGLADQVAPFEIRE
jgi:hypothetical protein